MIYKEESKNLFTLPNDYILAHCVSRDLAMGAGIAKVFRDVYGIKDSLKHPITPTNNGATWNALGFGNCIFARSDKCPWLVGNLITKERYYEKPNYESLRCALADFKDGVIHLFDSAKVGMPLIGCGLDKLEWEKVSVIIKDTFADTDIEVFVCRL